ncbi:M6 family metalloprotease domain-containing protein [Oceanobacillus luteolus]|uniref:M6 family metalloprotease domain-containing protein n=1 Tax=Oceanobacillus luteolus TaxID=1274358 RepID=UPI00203E7662|nr:M6 family metalloprotease domain-containing protein [Oceanobacillus luteolus]MCM3740623.1 M6 family metalloprotease domain-containing protein [Oceanobacillus luteolus]
MKLRRKVTILTTTILLALSSPVAFAAEPGLDNLPGPVDPQSWVNPDDMTWNDYIQVPGIDWNTADFEPETELKGALILVDFPDQDFILTQPKGSEIAGNPQIDAVPREELGEWWKDFLNTPSELNNYQTIDGFWKENSQGKWGVSLDSFGPYRLDKYEFQYGLNNMNPGTKPDQYPSGNLFTDGIDAAAADILASGEEYDFAFIVHAGYDESTVWQEFGEMMFLNKESVSDEFGPPDLPGFENTPNWAQTRYVPWTSYYAAKTIWSAASSATLNGKRIRVSIQGESDGMSTFAHEFGHLRGLPDNYNNAALDPRTYSGYWETMSRGSFNGPGGTHTRWMIPATLGSSLPAPHMLRNKIEQGFVSDEEVLQLDRDELEESGPVFADIIAREVPVGSQFGRTGFHGINISMDDLTPSDYLEGDWRNDILSNRLYENYTLEVVDRVGADSFAADSGVLIAKTKERGAPTIWVVDSHPEDINLKDFTRPDGTTAMVTKGDPRQLLDALFKAGNGETLVSGQFDGSIDQDTIVSEYIDPYNKLHFYILGNDKDDEGVLRYQVAVRNTEGSGNYDRGVDVSAGNVQPAVEDKVAVYHFNVSNTGEAKDLIRINASAGEDWTIQLDHNVIAVEAGETVEVPVYVKIPNGKTAPESLTFTATSETDSNQSVTETNLLPSKLSAAGVSSVIDSFNKEGEFFNKGAAQALKAHLKSVEQFEKKGSPDKVIKHLNDFKKFLDTKKDANHVSNKAYRSLKAYADAMIEIWQ